MNYEHIIVVVAIITIFQIFENSGQCEHSEDFRKKRNTNIYKLDAEEFSPHIFEEGECKNTDYRDLWKKTYIKSKCKNPIEESVELIPDMPFVQYIPSKVLVKRCGGMCDNQMSCVPTEKKEIRVPVRMQQQELFMIKSLCGYVTVEEHTKCACKCSLMAHHCNEKQMYNKAACRCDCMDPFLSMNCYKEGKKWNNKQCTCECPKRVICSTGFTVDMDTCKCVPL